MTNNMNIVLAQSVSKGESNRNRGWRELRALAACLVHVLQRTWVQFPVLKWVTQPPITPAPRDLTPFFWPLTTLTCTWHTYLQSWRGNQSERGIIPPI